jgi:hypothetical protein
MSGLSPLGWPDPYTPTNDTTGSPLTPTWQKDDVIRAGLTLAQLFVTDRNFATAYLDVVQAYEVSNMTAELVDDYRRIIFTALKLTNFTTFNANDFANLHRATWLWMLEGFACLVNKNPHVDWGNPLRAGPVRVSRGDAPPGARCFHNVPNKTGYFGLHTADMPVPPPLLI